MDFINDSNVSAAVSTSVEESTRSANSPRKAEMQPGADPIWSQVQDLILELTAENPEALTVRNRSIADMFADIASLAMAPNLLPRVGNSIKRTRTLDPHMALLEHRRLVAGVEIFLLFISMKNAYGRIVITSQLSNILVALMQLCYAPIRAVQPSDEAIPTTIQGWLEHGDQIRNPAVNVNDVVAEMQRDRLRLREKLQKLTDTLFHPSVVESFLRMLNPSSPPWLKRAVSSHLSKEIVRERGLSSFLCATSQVLDRDTPWLQLEKVALLVTRPPSTISEADYTRNMGKQLKEMFQQKNSRSEMTLLVAIVNAFLTHKPELSCEFVLEECFPYFATLLRLEASSEDQKISAEDIQKHLHVVRLSCEILPKDSALLEAFCLLMPAYLGLAMVAIRSDCPKSQIHLETIVRLASSLSEGADVILACLDPHDLRFQLPCSTCFDFDENGNAVISAARNDSLPRPESYELFFSNLFKLDETFTCQVCLRLMDHYQCKDVEESNVNSEFWRVCVPLLTKLIELCRGTIEKNEEFAVRTIINNLNGVRDSQQAQEILKLIEVLLRSVNNLSLGNRRRLRASVRHLEKVEGELASKAIFLRNEIVEQLAGVEPFRLEPRFLTWKCAPTALRIIANKPWSLDENSATGGVSSGSIEVETDSGSPRRRGPGAKSVFGTMSDYLKVKDELMDPDIAIRGHGFIELRKLLAARDSQAENDLDRLCDLCKVALEEEDSYVYLGAVQCYALIVGWRTNDYLPGLLESFKTPGESDLKMKLTETLLRCIMSFGDMSPLYCETIVTAIINCCEDENIDTPTKCAAASLLGQAVGYIPNRSSYFRRVVEILVYMIAFEHDEVLRRAAASGLAEGLKCLDTSVLINDYPTEVRDIHRVIKGLYTKCGDDALKIHFQEILIILGGVAKTVIKGSA